MRHLSAQARATLCRGFQCSRHRGRGIFPAFLVCVRRLNCSMRASSQHLHGIRSRVFCVTTVFCWPNMLPGSCVPLQILQLQAWPMERQQWLAGLRSGEIDATVERGSHQVTLWH